MRTKLKLKRMRELVQYFFKTLRDEGVGNTLSKTLRFFRLRMKKKDGRFLAPEAELARQRGAQFDGAKISVVCALYNTPPAFLRAFVNSVLAQTYENFELCLADASDGEHAAGINEVLAGFSGEKIRYVKLSNNGGISENSNAAAQLASGDYLAFADHDDILAPDALYEMALKIKETGAGMLYSDEALFENDHRKVKAGHFKPDFSPQYLLSCNYICHLLVLKKDLFFEVGGLRSEFDGAQDHDLILRVFETGTRIEHVARVLYYWRVHSGSTSGGGGAKPYAQSAGERAVAQHLERIGVKAKVSEGLFGGTYRVQYALPGNELVSILIPNKDHVEDLEKLLVSVYEKTLYRNFEIIIAENNSQNSETFAYYETLPARFENLQVVKYSGSFNYSAINNFARTFAKGDYLLLLNNDMQVITPEWLGDMLGYCRQEGVGIVGAKLLYEDDTIQHAGVITGLGSVAGHSHKYFPDASSGYMFRAAVAQNLSAVTAACLLVRASVFDEVKGLDETLAVAYNDVDFCLRVRAAGHLIVYTPFAKLYHFESKSRGADTRGDAKERFKAEQDKMKNRHGKALLEDEYYSPYLTLDAEDFSEAVTARYK